MKKMPERVVITLSRLVRRPVQTAVEMHSQYVLFFAEQSRHLDTAGIEIITMTADFFSVQYNGCRKIQSFEQQPRANLQRFRRRIEFTAITPDHFLDPARGKTIPLHVRITNQTCAQTIQVNFAGDLCVNVAVRIRLLIFRPLHAPAYAIRPSRFPSSPEIKCSHIRFLPKKEHHV